ncbi:hypothetical protein M0R88_15760 [Halorussus gelatinilyticus]|uniref:Uncharacterized protein n=1 Tax=Halorussus gelatinilyticus TaxID=2937524 RepID=A0A8U0IFV0_9EURY|nr:hypothetical protein [Halorussus gelatinilyticus]UPV99959.1 hypothetical protein M0R88_15760 [Halorussus gelatinilyticus]
MSEIVPAADVEDVFTDTCVLFAYAVEGEADARKLFEDSTLDKVASERIKREFVSVADRHQDIHRELLEFAATDDLDEYEPTDLHQKNDVRYVIDLYSDLTDMDDVEVVRRLNELINRLEKARDELFETDGVLTILPLDGVDAQLVGLLRGVVENEDDIRVLCDAAAWSRNGGSGTFLTEDTEDLLGSDEDGGNAVEGDETGESGDSLPDSFADFLGSENKSVPERINDQIVSRYDTDSALQILSIEDFLTIEAK